MANDASLALRRVYAGAVQRPGRSADGFRRVILVYGRTTRIRRNRQNSCQTSPGNLYLSVLEGEMRTCTDHPKEYPTPPLRRSRAPQRKENSFWVGYGLGTASRCHSSSRLVENARDCVTDTGCSQSYGHGYQGQHDGIFYRRHTLLRADTCQPAFETFEHHHFFLLIKLTTCCREVSRCSAAPLIVLVRPERR